MQTGQVTKARSKPRNILRGITPTASTFDNNPTNLSNSTNGDYSDGTGTGNKVLGGAGVIGEIIFDLGTTKTVLLGGKIAMWSTANSTYAYAAASEDRTNYKSSSAQLGSNTATYESIGAATMDLTSTILTGSKIKLYFRLVGGAGTGNIKLYEITAYEVGV